MTTISDQIQITANYTGKRSSNPPAHLEVSISNNIPLKIESKSASIVVRDYVGELEAVSISGDIVIDHIEGVIVAPSNRGDNHI